MCAVITMPGVVGVMFFGIATYALIVASGRVSVVCCVVIAGSFSGTIGGWGCPKSEDCAPAGTACAAAIAAADPPINLLRSIVVMEAPIHGTGGVVAISTKRPPMRITNGISFLRAGARRNRQPVR